MKDVPGEVLIRYSRKNDVPDEGSLFGEKQGGTAANFPSLGGTG
jgi:hypothetical protein